MHASQTKDFEALLAIAGSEAATQQDTAGRDRPSAAAASKRTLQRVNNSKGKELPQNVEAADNLEVVQKVPRLPRDSAAEEYIQALAGLRVSCRGTGKAVDALRQALGLSSKKTSTAVKCTTIAIVHKSARGSKHAGKQSSMFTLTDLAGAKADLLFAKASCEQRLQPGCMLALLDVKVKHADGRPTICINSPSQLAVLGNSVDFRLCKGMGEGGDCREAVDGSKTMYCKRHAAAMETQIAAMARPQLSEHHIASALRGFKPNTQSTDKPRKRARPHIQPVKYAAPKLRPLIVDTSNVGLDLPPSPERPVNPRQLSPVESGHGSPAYQDDLVTLFDEDEADCSGGLQ